MTPGNLLSILEYGYESVGLMGQPESGDLHIITETPVGVMIGVIDGLGHGKEAANAANLALRTIETHASESVINIVRRCDECLRHTRGAVMALASINANDETITWLSIGNIEGTLIRVNPKTSPGYEHIITRAGVVGYRLPPPLASVLPIAKGDLLVFCTDGIRDSFQQRISHNIRYAVDVLDKLTVKQVENLAIGKPVERPAMIAHEYALENDIDLTFISEGKEGFSPARLAGYISRKYSKGTDDALVLVAKYRGRP